jgi:hypothetical protein
MPPHLLDPFHIFILLAAFLTLAVAASASLAKGPSFLQATTQRLFDAKREEKTARVVLRIPWSPL